MLAATVCTRRYLTVLCLWMLSSIALAQGDDRRVLLVTLDGLRWQEVFGGADASLLNGETGGAKGVEALKERFWSDDVTERRRRLLPFLTDVVEQQGVLVGNPETGPVVRVSNGKNFSYPGYSELLTGMADDRIDSNDKIPNPNVTVLEWLHQQDNFKGRVAAFCSWDVFPFIINEERSGIPVNAGWEPFEHASKPAALDRLNRLGDEFGHYWDNVRYDYLTFSGAIEYVAAKQPRVLYVSLGETDDWAHARRYDLYLDAAHRNDRYIRLLWEATQRLPEYAGKTSLVITTDHGRGDTPADWTSHGENIPGSDLMWAAAIGPGVMNKSFDANDSFTQSQIAATVAALVGQDYASEGIASPLPIGGR